MAHTSSLQAFTKARSALIEEDRGLRRENLIKHLRSEKEIEADAIVSGIRAEEAKTVWTANYPDIPHVFPGMEFLTAKRIIQTTKIFKILSKMPKGGLLHAHLDAMVDARILLQLALNDPLFHVRAHQPLAASSLATTLPEFSPLPSALKGKATQLGAKDYSPGTWVSIQGARASFPEELGGSDGFDKWVVGSMVLNPTEAYHTYNTSIKIWDKFKTTFSVGAGLLNYRPIWREYLRGTLVTSIEDGISYIEARLNFMSKLMYDENGEQTIPHREWVILFNDVVKEVKAEMEAAGRGDEFVGAKIIYIVVRVLSPEEMEWYLDDCLALKKEFPDLIAGFDIAGHEDVLHPLSYYLKELLAFKERQKEAGLDIPFLFHAGETLGDGTEADMNLYDAILLGTKRIGHGFSITKHPKLLQLCRERGIAIEICPISNEILRLAGSMPMHPLPVMMNNGVPISLNSDDPSVFGNMGLTYDFFQVLVSSEVTTLSTLKSIARDSIEFSTLDGAQKEEALAKFERRWQLFASGVVEEYGAMHLEPAPKVLL